MKGSQLTYKPFSIIYQSRILLSFCFLAILFANPIINSAIVSEEMKYELFESSEKENSTDKESVGEIEDENPYFHFRENRIQLNKKQSMLISVIGRTFLSHSQDIQLPPPRQVFV